MKAGIKSFIVMTFLILVFNVVSSDAQFLFFGNPLIGEKAPEFTLESLEGDKKDLGQLRDGKDAILFFWATWCPHCRNAITQLSDKAQQLKARDVEVLLINEGEKNKTVRQFIKRYTVPFEILLDQKRILADEYHLIGLPTFVYIQKDGTVKTVKHSLIQDLDVVFGKAQ
jgi:peroxiredoxin